ncbi:MAG: tyrosine-protein phosphatase [Pseudomonadota bacterium]
MNKKKILGLLFATLLLGVAVVQFIPGEPLLIPAELDEEQRAAHRVLNFKGIANFRDIGGYKTFDGRTTKWGVLYRSGNWADASRADLQGIRRLGLNTLVDFRSTMEKEEEPDRLPDQSTFAVVEIPTLDGEDSAVAEELRERIENGNFGDFDPDAFMIEANRALVTKFKEQYREFFQTVLAAKGEPVIWHCSAGKDRAGFAAAALLRVLGVDQETVLDDYMLSKTYSVEARRNLLRVMRVMQGEDVAQKLEVLMGVERDWLEAAFDEIDQQYGNFDGYVREGLGLTEAEVQQLRDQLLE